MPRWVTLYEALVRLNETHGPLFGEGYLISAIASGRVRLRGVPHGEYVPHLIDAREIEKPTSLEISGDRLRKKGSFLTYPMADYLSVEVDCEELDAHVANMAPRLAAARRPTDAAVCEALKRRIEGNPQPRNWQALLDEVRAIVPGVTQKQYKAARKQVLPPKWLHPGRRNRA